MFILFLIIFEHKFIVNTYFIMYQKNEFYNYWKATKCNTYSGIDIEYYTEVNFWTEGNDGGLGGIWTPDLRHAKAAFIPLNYQPAQKLSKGSA